MLKSCDFSRAKMQGANLDRAVLTFSHFVGADLRDANLTNADLSKVDFTGADLTGANLTGADSTAPSCSAPKASTRSRGSRPRSTSTRRSAERLHFSRHSQAPNLSPFGRSRKSCASSSSGRGYRGQRSAHPLTRSSIPAHGCPADRSPRQSWSGEVRRPHDDETRRGFFGFLSCLAAA